jgi:hypothetical protein
MTLLQAAHSTQLASYLCSVHTIRRAVSWSQLHWRAAVTPSNSWHGGRQLALLHAQQTTCSSTICSQPLKKLNLAKGIACGASVMLQNYTGG